MIFGIGFSKKFWPEFATFFASKLWPESRIFCPWPEKRQTWKSLESIVKTILSWHVALCNNGTFSKRKAEKRNGKHHGKTSKIHAKSDGKSCRFRKSMADSIFHAFCSTLAQFLVKNVLWELPGRAREAQGPSRGRLRGSWGGSRGTPGDHFG